METTREVSQEEARRDPDAPFVRLSRREFDAWLKIEEARDTAERLLQRIWRSHQWGVGGNPTHLGEDSQGDLEVALSEYQTACDLCWGTR